MVISWLTLLSLWETDEPSLVQRGISVLYGTPKSCIPSLLLCVVLRTWEWSGQCVLYWLSSSLISVELSVASPKIPVGWKNWFYLWFFLCLFVLLLIFLNYVGKEKLSSVFFPVLTFNDHRTLIFTETLNVKIRLLYWLSYIILNLMSLDIILWAMNKAWWIILVWSCLEMDLPETSH